MSLPLWGVAPLAVLGSLCLAAPSRAEFVTPYTIMQPPYYAQTLSPSSFTNEVPADGWAAHGLLFPPTEATPTSGNSTVLARLDYDDPGGRIVWTGAYRWWHLPPFLGVRFEDGGFVSAIDPSLPVEVTLLGAVDGVGVTFDWEGGPGTATLTGHTRDGRTVTASVTAERGPTVWLQAEGLERFTAFAAPSGPSSGQLLWGVGAIETHQAPEPGALGLVGAGALALALRGALRHLERSQVPRMRKGAETTQPTPSGAAPASRLPRSHRRLART